MRVQCSIKLYLCDELKTRSFRQMSTRGQCVPADYTKLTHKMSSPEMTEVGTKLC